MATQPQPQRFCWSNLPIELLSIIFQKLTDCEDISHCAAACLSWQSVIETDYHLFKPILYPFVTRLFNDNNQTCLFVYNPQARKLHEISLPELNGRYASCSSNGWLLTYGTKYKPEPENMHLINLFTRSKIKLPPPPKASDRSEDCRVITSTSPLNPSCIFLFSTSRCGEMFICKHGDASWMTMQVVPDNPKALVVPAPYDYLPCYRIIHSRKTEKQPLPIHDFQRCADKDTIFYKGDFYCIGRCGIIFRITYAVDSYTAEALPIEPLPTWSRHSYKIQYYLVELNGYLFLTSRSMYNEFSVCKLDWKKGKWIAMESIGNHVILLGRNNSTSFVPRKKKGYFKRNRIYFLDEKIQGRSSGTGVYNIISKSTKPLYTYSYLSNPHFVNWGIKGMRHQSPFSHQKSYYVNLNWLVRFKIKLDQ